MLGGERSIRIVAPRRAVPATEVRRILRRFGVDVEVVDRAEVAVSGLEANPFRGPAAKHVYLVRAAEAGGLRLGISKRADASGRLGDLQSDSAAVLELVLLLPAGSTAAAHALESAVRLRLQESLMRKKGRDSDLLYDSPDVGEFVAAFGLITPLSLLREDPRALAAAARGSASTAQLLSACRRSSLPAKRGRVLWAAYFPALGLVKLGLSAFPERELAALRRLHTTEVELLVAANCGSVEGEASVKSALSKCFAPFRHHGDFYFARPELVAFVLGLLLANPQTPNPEPHLCARSGDR